MGYCRNQLCPIFHEVATNYALTQIDNLNLFSGVNCQDEDEEKFNKLCEDKSAGELFRLKAGKDNCRDVIQCTSAVSLSTCKTIILIQCELGN